MSENKRPTWDEYFLEMKDIIGKRATCDRGKSGCVIVDEDHHVVSTGYVGAPAGLPHCDTDGHIIEQTIHHGETEPKDHCVRTLHAEQNAIAYAARKGVSLKDCKLYCTMTPCPTCAMLIIAAGITSVICDKYYQNSARSIDIFSMAGIKIIHISEEVEVYNK